MKDRMLFKLVYDPKTHAILGAQIMSKKDLTANIKFQGVSNSGWKKKSA
jgi:pyruvate/2-oxoglutarate dehydrogenase complex dihydrolipoamide dehydrogenase (E3) component